MHNFILLSAIFVVLQRAFFPFGLRFFLIGLLVVWFRVEVVCMPSTEWQSCLPVCPTVCSELIRSSLDSLCHAWKLSFIGALNALVIFPGVRRERHEVKIKEAK